MLTFDENIEKLLNKKKQSPLRQRITYKIKLEDLFSLKVLRNPNF